MKIKLTTNKKKFENFVNIFSKMGLGTVLNFTETGLRFATGNTNAIGLIEIKKEFFDEYEGTGKFEVMLNDFVPPIKKFGKSICIYDEKNRLVIEGVKDKMIIPLMTDIEEHEKIPQIKFDTTTEVTMAELTECVDKIMLLKPDSVDFKYEESNLYLVANNNPREIKTELKKGVEANDEEISIGISFLAPLLGKLDLPIKLSIKTDTPLLSVIEQDMIKLTYFIAPRINQ